VSLSTLNIPHVTYKSVFPHGKGDTSITNTSITSPSQEIASTSKRGQSSPRPEVPYNGYLEITDWDIRPRLVTRKEEEASKVAHQKKVKEVKKIGACLRCRLLKLPVS
jgi:hypothetical protein